MCFFDYPNHLCVQNGILRRLDAIEILQIRLDKYYQFITFHYCDLLSTGGSIHTAMGNTALILGAYCSCVIIIVGFAMTVGYFFSPAQTSARPYLRVIGPGGVSVGVRRARDHLHRSVREGKKWRLWSEDRYEEAKRREPRPDI